MELREYLLTLQSSDSQQGIWVNPQNINDYRIGQFCFDNGGVYDDFIEIGSFEQLSFPKNYGLRDAIEDFLKDSGADLGLDAEDTISAYDDGELEEGIEKFLEEKASEYRRIQAEFECDEYLDLLTTRLDGESS